MSFVHKMRVHLGDDETSPMRDYDVRYHWIRGAPIAAFWPTEEKWMFAPRPVSELERVT